MASLVKRGIKKKPEVRNSLLYFDLKKKKILLEGFVEF